MFFLFLRFHSQGTKYSLIGDGNFRSAPEDGGLGIEKVPAPVTGAVLLTVFGINNLVGYQGHLEFAAAAGELAGHGFRHRRMIIVQHDAVVLPDA